MTDRSGSPQSGGGAAIAPQISGDMGTVAVVGDGRLGSVLVEALQAGGFMVSGPHKRGYSGDTKVAIVLLCVPDAAIASAAALISEGPAGRTLFRRRGTGLDCAPPRVLHPPGDDVHSPYQPSSVDRHPGCRRRHRRACPGGGAEPRDPAGNAPVRDRRNRSPGLSCGHRDGSEFSGHPGICSRHPDPNRWCGPENSSSARPRGTGELG